MAFRALFVFLSIAGAFSEDVASALASDDVCEGQDCSLELHQLRGMKVNYLEALEDASDDDLEERRQEELRRRPQQLRPRLRRWLPLHQGHAIRSDAESHNI